MKHSFDRFDDYIDYLLGAMGHRLLIRSSQMIGSLIIVALTAICAAHFVMHTPLWHTRLIQGDLNRIAQAVHALDRDCGIKNMRTGRYPLMPLTQYAWPSGQLHGMSVARPENWRGPYLPKVIALQGKPYELLKTNSSLYVVPGNGVTLPSGAIIGDTFSWCANTDVNALSQSGGILFYQSAPLVRQVEYGAPTPVKVAASTLPTPAQTLSNDLSEFAQALTFAQSKPYRLSMCA